MGDKTYDAIYKIAKNVDSNMVILWLNHVEISGFLLDCEDSKCVSDIVTLQDATVKCYKKSANPSEEYTMPNEKRFKWLNIPSCHIQAFTFKCCVND